jgi:HAD superfamily hydrolase (TIGR01459 family)
MDLVETAIYQHYLQTGHFFPLRRDTRNVSLEFLLEKYDVFFFDAFGTLYNYKNYVYPGAREMFQQVRAQKKHIRLITNAASQPIPQLMKDLHSMGFSFERDEIYSSGDLFVSLNQSLGYTQAFYIGHPAGTAFLAAAGILVKENPEQNVVVVSAAMDNQEKFAKATEILKRPGGHLIVLNPDAWAPRFDGPRVPVSGAYAHQLKLASGCRVTYCGKPFPEIFLRALRSIPPGSRAVMIGDTLGTDIAGALNAGIDAALIVGRNMNPKTLAEDETALYVRPTYYLV